MEALNGSLEKNGLIPPWDIIFTIQDPFIIEGLNADFAFGEHLRVSQELWKRTLPPELWFKWIGYFPVDSDLKENWVTRAIALPDYPVAYCEYGKKKMLEWDRKEFEVMFNVKMNNQDSDKKKATIKIPSMAGRIQVIEHGVDLDKFFPISKTQKTKFRKEFFEGAVDEDTFLIVNVSRNQPRKDLARTLKVFQLVKARIPNSHLYLHCRNDDIGGNIEEIARGLNLVLGKDYSLPRDFDTGIGYPIETVNKIYNSADVCITTTLGEGWGFITTEAMATKTPIVAPNITSIQDIFDSYGAEDIEKHLDHLRGIPVLSGSTTSEFICFGYTDNERSRPITNVDDMVKKVVWVYENPEKVAQIVERGFEWVQTCSWSNVVEKWEKVFEKAYEELESDREFTRKIDKTGRNEPCPCGSGLKFKKCHGNKDKTDAVNNFIEQHEKTD
jgi:glycosyltransferase involved in cell wall biosynthesis